jgi:hypothetical protein
MNHGCPGWKPVDWASCVSVMDVAKFIMQPFVRLICPYIGIQLYVRCK